MKRDSKSIKSTESVRAFTKEVEKRKKAEKQEANTKATLEQQLRIFDTALSNTLDFNYIFDLKQRFTYVNKPLLSLWGKTMDEVYGKNFEELGYPPELVALHKKQLNQVIKTKKLVKGENAYTNHEGKTGYYEYIFVPVFGKNGKVEAISGTTHDITDHKNIEELKARATEDRYRVLFNSIDEGFCVVQVLFDKKNKPIDYRFLEINPSFEKQTGLKDALGKTTKELGIKLENHWFELYGQVALTGKPIRFDNKAEDMNRYFDVYAFRYGEPSERKVAILFNDITERRISEERLHLQQQRLYNVFMHTPAAVAILIGPELVFQLANAHYLQLIGKKTNIIGKPLYDVLPEVEGSLRKIIKNVVTKGERFIANELPVTLDWINNGKPFTKHLNFIYEPYYEGDKPNGLITFAYDVSEQVAARKKVEESEQRFRAVWESVSEAIAISDENGTVFSANPAYFELYGYASEEIINKDFSIIFPKNARSEAKTKYKAIFKGDRLNHTVESKIQRADGTERIVESNYDFITSNGKRIAMISTIRDITERKELEKQKDDFLAVASHELKTPVTSIKAYGQVLQTIFQREGNSKAVTQLAKMDAQVDKLTNLIADLLDVTKIHSGSLTMNIETFDFNELIKDIVSELQLITERHTILEELDKSKKIYGDKERIGQVLTNLISNAIKYSPHSKKIIVKTTVTSKNITLCVQDFGIGIPKDKQGRVFEQFFRVSGEKQHTFPGLGLGLFISNKIILKLGGRMWVESAEGKGSTFCFTLPLTAMKELNKNTDLEEELIKHE